MELNKMLIQAIEQSYEGFLLTDLDGRIFYANDAVEKISGEPLASIVNHTIKNMLDGGLLKESTSRILNKNPLTIYQKISNGKDVFITSKPVYDDDGEIICYVANYRNLTSLNHMYEEHLAYTSLNYLELERLRDNITQTEGLISHSPSMESVKQMIEKIAKTDATVLIQGESGTGKEVVAKNIHTLSDRKKSAYIQINCGAIPENLIESELFGYEKGAFTGANTSKAGLLEIANNGTVLLDEIGEMPLHLQVKLLRAIQTNEITRVGGTSKKQLNVRYIAATNKDLKQLVKEGKFREDLYYRLNVVQIAVPPLRERKEDVALLFQHFLKKFNRKYNKELQISAGALKLLKEYAWPGNVRQLENIVEQLVILAENTLIHEKNLPLEISKRPVKPNNTESKSLKEAVEEAEKAVIERALVENPSIRKAAKALGVSHATLLRKIERYKI
ncbi:sigma-54 interaction domain-containing protein [Lysinibacillus sp. LZ02]|uniref:sigma-54 interaction domain-containing protein n=1 Tax=Lysinibacillus sp. LZ02 TaxID=3420668 RepID=UPI003D36EC8D